MVRLEYFVVAESAAVDQFTNKVSIFDIIEQVSGKTFPVHIYQAVAVTLWRGEPADLDNDFHSKLVVHLPDGTQLSPFTANFKLKKLGHRSVIRMEGIQITKPGDLRFEMLLDGNHAADHIVTVKQI